jgi:hypothetical protein
LELVWRGEGLFICYDFPRYISLAELSSVGLVASIPSTTSVKVIAPLIADTEYFTNLKTNLQRIL